MPNYTPSQVYDKYVALQKQLATNITNKGVTASQTELYDNLIDKVAQIENLKGEERTLENFTNVLSEPKSIVQLEYPEPKNLFDINTTPQFTYSGATYTVSGTTITFKSNNIANNNFIYSIPTEVGKTYTVSVSSIYWDSSSFGIFLSSTRTVDKQDYGSITKSVLSRTFTATSDTLYIHGYLSYAAGDYTFTFDKLQVEKGSTATTYEPYPAPKTLNAKLGSKNLLDPSVYASGSAFKGITYTTNGDTITMTGTAEASLYLNVLSSNTDAKLDIPEQLKNRKIRLFAYGNTSTVELVLYDEAGAFVAGIHNYATSATDTTGCSKWGLRLRVTNGVTYNDTIKIMICEEGVEDSPAYTPYTSDFSTTTVTRCGKNLFDIDKAELTNAEIDGNGLKFTGSLGGNIDIKIPAGSYTLSFKRSVDGSIFLRNGKVTSGIIAQTGNTATSITFAFTGTVDGYLRLSSFTQDLVLSDIQLELSSTVTTYEPYQGQTYTPSSSGEVTGITNLYPTTTLLTDNAGVVFEEVTGQTYKEIVPSTDKNGIVKAYQPSVDSTIDSNITSDNIKKDVSILGVTGDYICNYTYDETTKELVLLI